MIHSRFPAHANMARWSTSLYSFIVLSFRSFHRKCAHVQSDLICGLVSATVTSFNPTAQQRMLDRSLGIQCTGRQSTYTLRNSATLKATEEQRSRKHRNISRTCIPHSLNSCAAEKKFTFDIKVNFSKYQKRQQKLSKRQQWHREH